MGVEQLCVFCAQLLKDFVALVRGVMSDFAQKIRDCVDAISQCSCLKRKKAAASKLYKPVLQQHERQAAQKFLQHLDTGNVAIPTRVRIAFSVQTLYSVKPRGH